MLWRPWLLRACIGIDDDVIIHTLENFSGIGRRFEIRYQGLLEINGVTQDVILIDDYAHHPTAITATLEAARKRFPRTTAYCGLSTAHV